MRERNMSGWERTSSVSVDVSTHSYRFSRGRIVSPVFKALCLFEQNSPTQEAELGAIGSKPCLRSRKRVCEYHVKISLRHDTTCGKR